MKLKDMITTILKMGLQLFLIWLILQLGNWLSGLLSTFIKIPGSIIGMLFLLLLLLTGVIKAKYFKESSDFLLKHMGFFFVPLGVSLLNAFDLLKDNWLSLLIILLVSCVLVMYISAKVTDLLIGLKHREVD